VPEPSLQERYAARSTCYGCGPANTDGLQLKSFARDGEVVADWQPSTSHEAYPGALNGGVIGTLLDCHMNWTAAHHLMRRDGLASPPATVTAEYSVRMRKPTPTNGPVHLTARVVDEADDRATVEAILESAGEICATGRGTFVAVKAEHPAYHRW
jgi:acyl-coenzyme A thioesterase PaaI-like protein